jgi:hypothetical protein
MWVVLQVLFRSVVLQVLGRMCVVLQVLGLLQVLGQVLGQVLQVLGLGLGLGLGRGLLLITVHPPTKLHFRQSWATPEPQNKSINDTGTTPEGKKVSYPG